MAWNDSTPRPLPVLTAENVRCFWSKIDRTSGRGPNGDCWVWTAHADGHGYGRFHVRRRHLMASRIAYFLSTEKDPFPLNVLHHCDNPPCCNPAHLYAGTKADNMRDMSQRGRWRNVPFKGEANSHAKLTPGEVLEIRDQAKKGMGRSDLAQRYKISREEVGLVITRKRWPHI